MAFDRSFAASEPIYTNVQKCILKVQSGEERHQNLRVTVIFSKSTSKVCKQVLTLQLSDDDDPFLFFALTLTQNDYLRLKQLQGLLVDFEAFPAQLARLLEQCSEKDCDNSKFLLLFEEEKCNGVTNHFLKIVETNNFKHLCHLVLQLVPGDDADIKKIMLEKIKVLKEQKERAEKSVGELEAQLYSKNKLLAQKEEQLTEINHKWKEDRLTFKAESSKELCEETEKLRQAQLDLQLKAQRDRSELEDKYQNYLKEKDSEISRLRLEHQILQEKKSQADLTISDQARRIDALEKEVTTLRTEVASLRKQSSKLDSDYHEKEKYANNLKTKLAVTEQETKDMAILMKRQQELLNAANEQKLHAEETLNEKERQLQRKLSAIRNLSDELTKANEIIVKIQKDFALVEEKLKVRTAIALEQEKAVEKYSFEVKELKKINSSKEKQIKSLTESEQKLKTELSQMKILLDAKDDKLKDNEKLIDWLNRRLAEQPRIHVASNAPGGTSTPFARFRENVNSEAPLPYSTIIPSNNQTQSNNLDLIRNNQVEERASPTPHSSPSEVQSKSAPVPSSKENIIKTNNTRNNSLPAKTKPRKPVRTPGFKRTSLPEVQATSVPSSYFLK